MGPAEFLVPQKVLALHKQVTWFLSDSRGLQVLDVQLAIENQEMQ